MKHVLAKLFCATVLVVVLPACMCAQADNDGCSNATLRGDYGFQVSGQISTPNGTITRDGVALTHFDGDGHLSQVDFVMSNGSPMSAPSNSAGFHILETGTYQVNADCTGNAEIDFPAPPNTSSGAIIRLMFVLSNHGSTIHTIVSALIPPGSSQPVPASIHSDAEKLGDLNPDRRR